MELHVDGPLFIGSGKEIAKKEYAFSAAKKRIYVMNTAKLCQLLGKKGLFSNYQEFIFGFHREDLGKWLEKNGVREEEYRECVRYRLDSADAAVDTHSKLSVMEFIKDAYGMPYVPGSSVKGMLRTALLAYDIHRNPGTYAGIKAKIKGSGYGKGKRNLYLKKEASELENSYFRCLHRSGTKENDAVNDMMSGMIVGDSEPLSAEDLILCQRVELHADGTEKKLNVLREALRPGTTVRFPLTIDTGVCKISKEMLEEALRCFGEIYFECFLRKFPSFAMPKSDTVWLGGGAGFVTKTEVYPLFGDREGVEMTADIFHSTAVPKQHKHDRDKKLGVSPHICKVTYYDGRRRQMGMCHIKITRKN